MFSTVSSGDLIADRRFALAAQLHDRGDTLAALDLLDQTQDLVPSWPPLPFRRGELCMALGRREDALGAFKAYLALDPEDRMGAAIKLALLGAMAQPETLPAPYIEALFDGYAPRFDTALVQNLFYRVPQLLAALVEKHRPRHEQTGEYILDLGCGTGLAGEAFIKRAGWLEGIDLSSGMIEQAAAKGIYNRLEQKEILAALTDRRPGALPCQLILAADVLVYIGELEPLFRAIGNRLAPGGLFAFSVQKLATGGSASWLLGEDHRYAHSAACLDRCLETAGLRLLAREEHAIRKDGGADLIGYVVLAERPREAEVSGTLGKRMIAVGKRKRPRIA